MEIFTLVQTWAGFGYCMGARTTGTGEPGTGKWVALESCGSGGNGKGTGETGVHWEVVTGKSESTGKWERHWGVGH